MQSKHDINASQLPADLISCINTVLMPRSDLRQSHFCLFFLFIIDSSLSLSLSLFLPLPSSFSSLSLSLSHSLSLFLSLSLSISISLSLTSLSLSLSLTLSLSRLPLCLASPIMLGTEQVVRVVSSIPGSVGYISHGH